MRWKSLLLVVALSGLALVSPAGDVMEGEAYVQATLAVTACSAANPAVFTAAGHNLFTGNLIQVTDNGDINELAQICYPVTKIDANTFSLGIATKNLCPLASVDITTDTINIVGHTWPKGQAVIYTKVGATAIGGLVTATTYYLRDVGPNSFKLSATATGEVIDLTGTGSATQYFAMTPFGAAMAVGGGGIVVPNGAMAKGVALINGSVAHVSAVPVYLAASQAIPTAMPATTSPSGSTTFLDPGQPGAIAGPTGAELRYLAMNVSAGAVYVRYHVVY